MTLTIHLRDANAVRTAQVDDLVKLEFVVRHQDVGSWVLDLHPASPAAATVRQAITSGGTVANMGIEVERDGVIVMSGPAAQFRRTRQGMTERLTLSGPDDLVWLRRRLATPQPATTAPPYNTAAYDVRTGVASTVMRAYVNANVGPGAITARKWTVLALAADPLVGSTVTQQARYDLLLDVVRATAIAGGDLGFKVTSNAAGGLVFTVYQPVDRSATVVFSDAIGNLGDFDYELSAPDGNYGFGAGSGEDTARVITEASDTASVAQWGRIEFFRDRRDTSDTTQILQSVNEELAKRAEKRAISVVPIDTPTMSFVTHYGLGDKVTAVLDGVPIAEVVREVKVTYDAGGTRVQATLGTPGATPPEIPDIFRDPRTLAGRVTNLERR
jgi:hypothetical protein